MNSYNNKNRNNNINKNYNKTNPTKSGFDLIVINLVNLVVEITGSMVQEIKRQSLGTCFLHKNIYFW